VRLFYIWGDITFKHLEKMKNEKEKNDKKIENPELKKQCVTIHGDSGHYYLSKGISHINGIPVIQTTSPDEVPPLEQMED